MTEQIAIIVEEVIKHLPTRHNQKTHGIKLFESKETVTREKIFEFLKRYAKGLHPDRVRSIANDLYKRIGMKAIPREKMSAIISASAADLVQYGGAAKLKDVAQSVQDSLGYTRTTAHGACTAASTLMWLRMGKPQNIMPAEFRVGGEWHAVLYDQKSKIVIDPTAAQFNVFGKNVSFRIFKLTNSSKYKFKRSLSSAHVKEILVDEIAPSLFRKGIVLREEKSNHYAKSVDDYALGLLSALVLDELSVAIEALTEVEKASKVPETK